MHLVSDLNTSFIELLYCLQMVLKLSLWQGLKPGMTYELASPTCRASCFVVNCVIVSLLFKHKLLKNCSRYHTTDENASVTAAKAVLKKYLGVLVFEVLVFVVLVFVVLFFEVLVFVVLVFVILVFVVSVFVILVFEVLDLRS